MSETLDIIVTGVTKTIEIDTGLQVVEIETDTQIVIVEGQGEKGDQGANASLLLLEIEAEEDILAAGWPIAINRATGHGKLARADNYMLSFVIGFSKESTLTGFVCPLEVYAVDLTDWTAIAGTQYLTPGNQYFLKKTTGISAVDLSSVATAMVGTALSPTTLKLSITNPILM